MAPESMQGRVVIAGGSGFLGLSLARHVSSLGAEVVVLSRSAPREAGPWRHVQWDGRALGDWANEIDGARAVVNLCGRSVDCIKTPDHCDEILRSRVEPTRVLGQAIKAAMRPPRVWAQMSTAHLYGDPPEAVCDERSSFGYGLARFVGEAWEAEFNAGCPESVRGVILRTTFVLGRKGGALTRLAWLTRRGLGGTISHGRQGVSWIHERDLNRIFERAIRDDSMRGAYISTAPTPVSNAEFMRELRRALGVKIGLPATAWMVRIGAKIVLRTDPDLALYGRYCVPARLLADGFEFEFPRLREALVDLAPATR